MDTTNGQKRIVDATDKVSNAATGVLDKGTEMAQNVIDRGRDFKRQVIDKGSEYVKQAQHHGERIKKHVVDTGTRAVNHSENFIRQNPKRTVLSAFLVGAALGAAILFLATRDE